MAPAAALRWELAGAVCMILAGSALHFAFGWSGGWRPLAVVAAVNESIWEHLKLAFWPGVAWALIPAPGGATLAARLAVRGITLAVTAGLIVAVFTTYTAILGRNLLVLDIGTFAGAIIAGQVLASRLTRGPLPSALGIAGGLLLAAQLAAYALLTFHAPGWWLFLDGRTGLAGIPPG